METGIAPATDAAGAQGTEPFAAGFGHSPDEALRRAALENAPRALETIVQIMNSDKAGSGDRLRAAITVIERAYGRHDAARSPGEALRAARAEQLGDIEAEMERLKKELGD